MIGYLSLAKELTNIRVPVVTAVWAIWKIKIYYWAIQHVFWAIWAIEIYHWAIQLAIKAIRAIWLIGQCEKVEVISCYHTHCVVTHVIARYLSMMSQGVTSRYQTSRAITHLAI